MICLKKLEKLVNTIKKYKFLLVFILLISSKSHALKPEYEKELFIGCYGSSKQYLGPDGAKVYYTCTIDKLSKKFSYEQIDQIFKMKPEEIVKATEFATIACENNK